MGGGERGEGEETPNQKEIIDKCPEGRRFTGDEEEKEICDREREREREIGRKGERER